VEAREAAVVAKADTLLDQVKNLLAQAERLTERAEQAGNMDTALRGVGQVRGVLELLGEVSGQLAGKGTQVNVNLMQPQVAPNFRTMSDDDLRRFLENKRQPPTLEAQITPGDPQ
jgi:hypothetical protein